MVFLDWGQAVGLAEAHSPRYRALIYLAVDGGLRWSELVGLQPSKIDLGRRKVRVTDQLVRLRTGEFLRKEPKTPAARRSIPIARATAHALEEQVARYASPGADGLVFPNGAGQPLTSSSFLTHHFGPARTAVGLSCRFHDLRHSSVALAIASGAHPKAIQARMGHSSINVTLDRYGHLFPELDEAIANAFDRETNEMLLRRGSNVLEVDFGGGR